MLIAHLKMKAGEREQVYSFTEEAVLGRGSAADVAIADPSISRRHALARIEGKTAVIEDLGSSNGTYLNGEVVRSATRAEDGDVVQLGAVVFELSITDESTDEIADPMATPTKILKTDSG